MEWGKTVKLGRDTISRLKAIGEELKLPSPNQVVRHLIEVYRAVKEEAKGQKISCPYCGAIGFQSPAQLRKHIAKTHLYDVQLDWARSILGKDKVTHR